VLYRAGGRRVHQKREPAKDKRRNEARNSAFTACVPSAPIIRATRVAAAARLHLGIHDVRFPDLGATRNYIDNMTQRWIGNRFEPMSPEEIKQANARPHVQANFDDVEGWSKRTISFGASDPIMRTAILDLDGHPAELRLMVQEPFVNTVELQRSGNPPERLWSMDARLRRISG
jgi:hypothetical protein